MGNTSGKREGKDGPPLSPKESPNTFEFKPGSTQLIQQGSYDEYEFPSREGHRPRASTISQSSLPALQPNALPTVFHWEGNAKNVYISGTFNNWEKKIPMVKSQGDFTVILDLAEGEHQYKFHVDGNWVHDHTVPTCVNEYGSYNNVIKVQKSDFEVFEALAIDSVNSGTAPRDISGSPPGEYNQDMPSRKLQEKTTGPPILPPHLLQVILNKDIALQCEPSLLPEPNHVMLNHLYALSIKDGVMALSATHRFKKKFVTTLFYKPI
ncbi:5'-AMP-activated protein kinase subunit beta-2-like isoform X3 [Ptychodera flava]|uniref:5'-AMP-activated protein kinase subunit beta-2-like isoform X3 n=1 Tax=Ptychodera flava TaxID=63121 RepID=UPI003969DCCC